MAARSSLYESGFQPLELGDPQRVADAGDDVLALRVRQVVAVRHLLARRGIARERDAGAGVLAMLPKTIAWTLTAVPRSSEILF
jgi:hypothetical protein